MSHRRLLAIHPAFTAEGYAREIGLQATRPERAEPHLAGLRAAGILAVPSPDSGTGPDGSAGRATADPSSLVQVGAPRDDGSPDQVEAPRDDGPTPGASSSGSSPLPASSVSVPGLVLSFG